MSREKFYITTAIAYPNGKPHIGHAYELIATDAMARFQRLDGKDVHFLTGSDEHGIKMLQSARKEGITPRELADRNTAAFQRMGEFLNSSHDDYIRTSEERHYKASQAIWQAMSANGDIYKGGYAGWYSVRDEAYYGEEELKSVATMFATVHRVRRSSGLRKKAISSVCRIIRTSCLSFMKTIPASSCRRSVATRSLAS